MDKNPFDLEAFLPYRLSIASNRVSRAFAQRYGQAFGLSIPEWRVLAVLGSFQPLSSFEICAKTEMDKAKVSRAVSRLSAAGLIRRAVDPKDKRLLKLAFSAKGRKVYDAIVPLAEEIESEVLSGFDAKERALLDRLLGRLLERTKALKLAEGGED